MEEVKQKLREINDYMPYGKTKALAQAHGVELQRAYDILQGRLEPSEADEAFVFACLDVASERKNRLNKIKNF